ncbi:MAG: hypothetical protein JST54_07300 [Deltaproteobacteria bacterium]|nr:hypothetical protein [Deltaproteobacteria bacterium]
MLESPERPRLASLIGWCGIIGAGLVLAGCVTSAWMFEREGFAYSIFGCFISELGDVVHSRGHAAFNGGLALGSLPLLVFMVALGQGFRGRLVRLAQLAGLLAGVGAFFVAVYPMNELRAHMAAANTFFYSGMISCFVYSIVIYRGPSPVPRAMAFFAAGVVAIFAAFLFLPLGYRVGPEPTVLRILPYQHPTFWMPPFVEWLVLASVLGWVLTLAVAMLRQRSA